MHPLKQKRTQFTNTNRDPKKKKKGKIFSFLKCSIYVKFTPTTNYKTLETQACMLNC
jgi:hypothetical protein